jgi:hypothetical protein
VKRLPLIFLAIEAGFISFAVGLYCSIVVIPCAVIAFGFTGIYIFGKSLMESCSNKIRARNRLQDLMRNNKP